jgi:hypothetical protein
MRIVFVCGLLILVCSVSRAQLKWAQTNVDLHPGPGDKEAVAHFRYENVGATPVRFREIHPSCGCTTTRTQKDVVQPGEKGEIVATLHFGDRVGPQYKTISVETDDRAHPYTTLALRAMIPQALEISPGLVYWQNGEALKPKSITVKTEKSVNSINVTSSNSAFQVKVKPVHDREFKIEVQPPAKVDATTGSTLTIQPENSAKKFTASAMIAAPSPTPAKP